MTERDFAHLLHCVLHDPTSQPVADFRIVNILVNPEDHQEAFPNLSSGTTKYLNVGGRIYLLNTSPEVQRGCLSMIVSLPRE